MNNTYSNGTFVDVRSPQEFQADHIYKALNIPLEQVANRIDEFKQMATPIIAYCRSGNRSGMAVSILKQNGIDNVFNGGGIDEVKQKLSSSFTN